MKKNNLFIYLLLVFTLGCGTDTGNPGLRVSEPQASTNTITDTIASSMCTKIRTCFAPTLTSCETKISTAINVPTTLGLNETTYPNLDSIQRAINSQTLHIDNTKSAACLNALTTISCSDASIQQSYSSADLENLNQAWKLLSIDTNCSQFIY